MQALQNFTITLMFNILGDCNFLLFSLHLTLLLSSQMAILMEICITPTQSAYIYVYILAYVQTWHEV